MENSSNPYYKRSLVVYILRFFLLISRRTLPDFMYIPFYNYGFLLFRKCLHIFYMRKLIYAWIIQDKEGITKAKTILRVMPFSLVGASGLEATYDVTYDVETRELSGNIIECGVAQGGSAALMSMITAQFGYRRDIWLFDSFEGLPDPTSGDFIHGTTGLHIRPLPKGSCLGTQEQVEHLLFDNMKLNRDKILLVKGWFENVLPAYREQVGDIAVLRIDADWYASVKCCLEHFYDRVVQDGYIIIDDYGSCYGAKKALDEFLEARNVQAPLTTDGRGGCHFVKPSERTLA